MAILNSSLRISTTGSKKPVKIIRYLGEGTQGEVHEAMIENSSVALKWYFRQFAITKQRMNLEELIRRGSPSQGFLWPLDIIEAEGLPGFGYIMGLRPPEYLDLNKLMLRKVHPTFRTLITACLNLTDKFLKLHSQGLCYGDINFNNTFVNYENGDVLICDNDNVVVNNSQIIGVGGTPSFMAPEIVVGISNPSSDTDLFSLSVLLFLMLFIHHPLEGTRELNIHCMDLAARNKLYGTDALFIFDPTDKSNAPAPGYHDNAIAFWKIYPKFIRDLFVRAFTSGLKDPQNGRVRESEWRSSLVSLRDSIIYCPNCGAENFYDVDAMKSSLKPSINCWKCKNIVSIPPRMRIGKQIIMLSHEFKLYPHHIDTDKLYDFSAPVSVLSQNPSNRTQFGIKNVSGMKWLVTFPDGTSRDLEDQRSVPIQTGLKINFGKVEGEIRI